MTKNIDPNKVKKIVDKAVLDAATGRTFNVAVAIESLGKLAISLAESVAELQANKYPASTTEAPRPSAETVIQALKDKEETDTAPDSVEEAPKKTRKGKTVLKG